MKLHSYLSTSCEIRTIDGKKGIYAKSNIQKNDLVAIWGGIIFSDMEIQAISKQHEHFLTHPVSVYDGYFIGSTSLTEMDDVEYMNHSCDPNVGVKGQIIILARRNILADEELCFDYETTEMHQETFECHCGAICCRKKIDGNSWKDYSFQKKNEGFFSWYIQEKIRKLNDSNAS